MRNESEDSLSLSTADHARNKPFVLSHNQLLLLLYTNLAELFTSVLSHPDLKIKNKTN